MATSPNGNERIRIVAEFDDQAVYDPALLQPAAASHILDMKSVTQLPEAELLQLIQHHEQTARDLRRALRIKRQQAPQSEDNQNPPG
jgi:hypothetical protein